MSLVRGNNQPEPGGHAKTAHAGHETDGTRNRDGARPKEKRTHAQTRQKATENNTTTRRAPRFHSHMYVVCAEYMPPAECNANQSVRAAWLRSKCECLDCFGRLCAKVPSHPMGRRPGAALGPTGTARMCAYIDVRVRSRGRSLTRLRLAPPLAPWSLVRIP
eukprot:4117457-Prymnesium_polylepis.2